MDGLRAAGVIPVLCDLFEPKSLNAAVKDFRPDVIAHQVTDLPDEIGKLTKFLAATDRARSEGTRTCWPPRKRSTLRASSPRASLGMADRLSKLMRMP
jgi:hypothetical protein